MIQYFNVTELLEDLEYKLNNENNKKIIIKEYEDYWEMDTISETN